MSPPAAGFAGAGRAQVRPLVLGAWDAFLAAVGQADLSRPSRLPGWRGQEVAVHLGAWDDYRALDTMLASARSGGSGPAPDVEAANAAVTAAHRDAGRAEVIAALHRHRAAVVRYLDEEDPDLDLAPTASTVGRLPMLSVLLGEAYELAVHGLDLVACGAAAPPDDALQAGLAALADVTGALTAAAGITGGAALHTPTGGWAFRSDGAGWTVTPTGRARPRGAVVEGAAETLLDASAGRRNAVALVARRQLKVHDVPALLRLAPVVEAAPGIPGAPLLRLAARSLSGVGGLAGRVLGRG